MNPRTISARKVASAHNVARLHLVSSEGETPITGFPGDLQDVSIVGMGEGIELERACLASIASLNSFAICAIDLYSHMFSFSPWLAPYFGAMTGTLESCLKLQRNWLDLLLPHAAGTLAASPKEDASEIGMDFAVDTFENF